jgi:hypothetical protein
MTPTLEDTQREKTTCIACGEDKSIGLVVCWDCFKYRKNPYKNTNLELREWLKVINNLEHDNRCTCETCTDEYIEQSA